MTEGLTSLEADALRQMHEVNRLFYIAGEPVFEGLNRLQKRGLIKHWRGVFSRHGDRVVVPTDTAKALSALLK